MNGKKLKRLLDTTTGCITMLAQENDVLRYHLAKITRYQTVERLRSHSEKDWGVGYEEALEMAYENVLTEARNALRYRPANSKPDGGQVPGRDSASTT